MRPFLLVHQPPEFIAIAATNRVLPVEVREGRFRADLYHRLSVYPLQVPPLRERLDDVPILAGHFLEQSRRRLGLARLSVTPAALATLRDYDWPGNVRELEHVMLRAALRAAAGRTAGAAVIEPWHLDGLGVPAQPSARPLTARPDQPLTEAVDDFQRRLIGATLEQAAGNWAETARRLRIDRGNLHRLARRLGLKG